MNENIFQNDEERLCPLCHTVILDHVHKNSLLHRFNFALYEWNEYRKKLVQNRHGIEVTANLVDTVDGNILNYKENNRKGSHITIATVSQATMQVHGINYLFTVKNIQKSNNVFIIKVQKIHPFSDFSIDDFNKKLSEDNVLKLQPGAAYSFKVCFKPKFITIGSFKMPISISLQTDKNEPFTIAREMVIVISDEEELTLSQKAKSPFTNIVWKNVTNWIEPTHRNVTLKHHLVPKAYQKVLKMGLKTYSGMSQDQYTLQREILMLLEPNYPTKENYRDFFHIVLWLDEIGAQLMLKRYNMENVIMKTINDKLLELEVPGLAEKRPSLIKGDTVNIRVHEDHTAYKGIIHTVNDTTIWIAGINQEFYDYIKECPDSPLDVSFELGRLSYERMHSGIENCIERKLLDYLFPEFNAHVKQKCKNAIYSIANKDFYNQTILNNMEQKIAVENILNCKSGKAPYIVFGPPGTGKTQTIVESILQIKKQVQNAKILVCAPANAACDMLASKLIQYKLTKEELIRVHTDNRDWKTVPDDVKPYSNYEDEAYIKLTGLELMKYRVVVTTLILSGKYSNKQYCPDFVFIDEAAQAMEPECTIAISLLKAGKQLVLAGDPKQLGPICASAVSQQLKLGVSLLERLMNLPLYTSYDPNFMTMLKLNYRAHPVVLKVPNELFYDDKLEAVSEYAINDPIANIFIFRKVAPISKQKCKSFGAPVEFCAIFAKEKREGRSPSYFNLSEVEMVTKYVKGLMNLKETTVKQNDIGIVTPYIRQVYRIKEKLSKNGFLDVEVGTTETFQGREKRIIIISTVRAQHSLLLHDRRYKLGFIKSEKRFNVALTRAMSKLIIIGCPNVLRYDKNWLKYIEFCEQKGAYFGPKRDNRTDELKLDIIGRLKGVQKKDVQFQKRK